MKSDLEKLREKLKEEENLWKSWKEFLKELDIDGTRALESGENQNSLKKGFYLLMKEATIESLESLESSISELKEELKKSELKEELKKLGLIAVLVLIGLQLLTLFLVLKSGKTVLLSKPITEINGKPCYLIKDGAEIFVQQQNGTWQLQGVIPLCIPPEALQNSN